MLATLLIVFREMIEAGLVVGIVLAATQGVVGRGKWVTFGVVGGVIGACLVALFADELSSLFEGSGQELFDATVLLVAVGMLTWHNVWMSSHGKEMAVEMQAVGSAVASGKRPLAALSIVVGVAVLREGSEVVLFLYGIAASGGAGSPVAMILGGGLGLLAGVAVSALMYAGLLAIPAHRLFAVTGGLITLLAAGLASQAVAFLEQAGYVDRLSTPLWDTSWLLSEDSIAGRMLHTLVGYTSSPTGAQLLAYVFVVAGMITLMRLVASNHMTDGKDRLARI